MSEMERRFRALTELSSDWYWEQDAELRFVNTGGRTELRAGISMGDHIGKRRWELPGTEIVGQSWDDHKAVLAARAPFQDLLLRRTGQDGSIYYVSVSGQPRYGKGGDFAGYHGVAKDVTARARAENALREAESRLRLTLDTAPGAICFFDLEERILTANKGYADLVERSLDQIPGSTLRTTVGDKAYAAARPYIERVLTGESAYYERRRTRSDGTKRDLHLHLVPHRNEFGRVIGACAMIVDVSEFKDTQRALLASEARFRALTELSSDWYWEQDENFRFVAFSSGLESAAGATVESHIGKTRWELPWVGVTPEQWAQHRATLEAHVPFRDFEYRRTNESGKVTWVSVSGTPIFSEAGKFRGYRGIGRNISERKRAEEVLRASERRFRGLANLWADWYWEQDEQLRFTYLSPEFERIAGFSTTTPLGKTRWEVPSEGVSAEQWAHHRALVDARMPFHDFEMRRANLQGEVVWLSASGVPVYDEQGHFRGYHGLGRNITERKRAEVALRESEERFRSLATLSSDYYWETDAEHRFRTYEYGPRTRALYTREQLIGRARWELDALNQAETWRALRAALDARLPFRDFEFARVGPDGALIHFAISGEPMLDETGAFIGYRGVGRDITDRRKAELEIRQASERYASLVDSIDGIVWEADPETFAFTFVGRQAERLLGYPAQQWIDESDFWRRHTHPEDLGWTTEFCRNATAERRNHEFEYRMIAVDGRTVWLRDLVSVVVDNDRVVRLRGIMLDVTDRKRAEEALQDSERRIRLLLHRLTEVQEAERRRIAAHLHDVVGQNLTALGVDLETTRTEMLRLGLLDCAGKFPPMARLLQETLDTLRQTMSDLRPPLLDDYGLVAALESHARQVTRRSGLQVAVEGPALVSRPAANVELALFRIAQEALVNAVKHARASQARVVLSHGGGRLRLSVEDDGEGFLQPAGARAQQRGGWGLPLMRERAEEVGGALRIEFLRKGTRIITEVPHVDPHHPG